MSFAARHDKVEGCESLHQVPLLLINGEKSKTAMHTDGANFFSASTLEMFHDAHPHFRTLFNHVSPDGDCSSL